MKDYMRHYGPVAVLLAAILAAAAVLTALTGTTTAADGTLRVMTANYPLYLAAKNVVGEVDGVEVSTLTAAASGCLHDYQLSPADRLRLEQADVILLNTADEEWLADTSAAGTRVDTSAGMDLLCSDHHHEHDHGDEEHADDNEHVWTSPRRYAAQVEAVAEALAEMHAANAAAYETNAAAYRSAIDAVAAQLPDLSGRRCVLFHESLAYLAEDLGLTVELTLTVGQEAGLSAADLSAVGAVLAEHPDALLLYDDQYTVRYPSVDGLASQPPLAVNTGFGGEGRLTDWLDGMEHNAALLTRLTEGTT